jgi:hypothetical protein
MPDEQRRLRRAVRTGSQAGNPAKGSVWKLRTVVGRTGDGTVDDQVFPVQVHQRVGFLRASGSTVQRYCHPAGRSGPSDDRQSDNVVLGFDQTTQVPFVAGTWPGALLGLPVHAPTKEALCPSM